MCVVECKIGEIGSSCVHALAFSSGMARVLIVGNCGLGFHASPFLLIMARKAAANNASGSRKPRTIKNNKIIRYKKKSIPIVSLKQLQSKSTMNRTENNSTSRPEMDNNDYDMENSVWNYIECHTFCKIQEGASNLYAVGVLDGHGYIDNYAIVVILNVVTVDGNRAVGCCSNCPSNDMLGYFALANLTNTTLNDTMLFSCVHIEAAAQRILAANGHSSTSLDKSVHWLAISNCLGPYDNTLAVGWHQISSLLHKRGPIHAYLSEEYKLYVFSVKKTMKLSHIYFCFKCCKYSCHHASSVSQNFDGAAPIFLKDIQTPTTSDERLYSKKEYLCNEKTHHRQTSY